MDAVYVGLQVRDWLSVLGFVVGLGGLGAAYWQYRASRVESRPLYRSATYPILAPFPTDPFRGSSDGTITILYRGETISSASRGHVAIWNSGRKTLDGDNLLHEEPFRLVVPDGCVLLDEPKVVKETRPSIHFAAARDPANPAVANLSFAFMDRRDGALLEVLYGGIGKSIRLEGGFKSSHPIRDNGALKLRTEKSAYASAVRSLAAGCLIASVPALAWTGIALIAMGLNLIELRNPLNPFLPWVSGMAPILLGALVVSAVFYYLERRPVPGPRSRRLPLKLRSIPESDLAHETGALAFARSVTRAMVSIIRD